MFGFTKIKKKNEFLEKYCHKLIQENWRLKKALTVSEIKRDKTGVFDKKDPKDVSYSKGVIVGLELAYIACLYIKDDGYQIVPDQNKTMNQINKYIKRYKEHLKKLNKRLTK